MSSVEKERDKLDNSFQSVNLFQISAHVVVPWNNPPSLVAKETNLTFEQQPPKMRLNMIAAAASGAPTWRATGKAPMSLLAPFALAALPPFLGDFSTLIVAINGNVCCLIWAVGGLRPRGLGTRGGFA